jgi:hypothetical protein
MGACASQPNEGVPPAAAKIKNSAGLKQAFATVKQGTRAPDQATMSLLWDQTDVDKVCHCLVSCFPRHRHQLPFTHTWATPWLAERHTRSGRANVASGRHHGLPEGQVQSGAEDSKRGAG